MNLKQALTQNKPDEFIKEHEAEGDKEAFDATLSSMVGTSKEAPAASSQDDDES